MKKIFLAFRATVLLSAKEKSCFGFFNQMAQYLLKAATLGALIMIWNSLFSAGVDTGGMTLHQFCVYTVMSTVLAPLTDIHTPASGWLHEGTLLRLYLRPTGVFTQLAAYTLGGALQPLLFLSVPVIAVSLLLGMDLRPASACFFLSLPLTVLQGFAVDLLFACLLIRLGGLEWVVHDLRGAMTALLSGSLIPFAALPGKLGPILQFSPLGTLAGAPLALYTCMAQPGSILPAQIFWNLLLWPLAARCLAASRERMVCYGG